MTAATHPPIPYTPSVEHVEPDELQTIEEIEATMQKIRETTFGNSGHAMRSVHVKSHGVLRATLTVASGLPETLAQGLFAAPGAHECLLRFSTNPGDVLDDNISVPRGLAIKIFGAEGERLPGSEADRTQNFVLVDAPAFNAPSAKKFLGSLKPTAATTDRMEGTKKVVSTTMQALEKVVEAFGGQSAKIISLGGHRKTHVLGHTYFSAVAHRHGGFVAKVAIAPVSPELRALTDQEVDLDGRPDGLREDFVAFMRTHRAEWALQVQLCTDLEDMPVEDASVEWDATKSPYVTVARIVAEPQVAWSDAIATAVDDGMFFSPWRGLEAHRPLGNVMRARRLPYERSAQFRAARNGTPVVEPQDLSAYPA